MIRDVARFALFFYLFPMGLSAAERKPNIIVIVADDLGYADVGFQGCKDIPTPHLDTLAKSGIRCTNGYVSHPFCSPTRAGLLTGRYQQRFGHENNPAWMPNNTEVGLPLTETTIAHVMANSGYASGAVGKWHLGAHTSFHPNKRGFQSYYGLLGGGHQYFDHNQFQTNPMKAKQEYFIPLVRNSTPVQESEYLTDILGREAAAYVETNRAKPFFLYLAFNAPHTPLQAPESVIERVKAIEDPKLRTYAAMVCSMDDAIGQMMKKLDEHKLTNDTLIFFFSDNGGPVAVTNCRNMPLRGAKGQVYEGGVRVPYVVSWPGTLKPGTFDGMVSSLDVFATALAAGQVVMNESLALDGVDLLPHLKGTAKTSLEDRTLYWRTGGGQNYAVRHKNYKLVQVGKKAPELYDLSKDISEATDIAGEKPDVLAALIRKRDAWNSQLVAPKWQSPQQPKKKAKN